MVKLKDKDKVKVKPCKTVIFEEEPPPAPPASGKQLADVIARLSPEYRRNSTVQFLMIWEVFDLPVHVQRQVPSSWMKFPIFYVKVDSDSRPLPWSSMAVHTWKSEHYFYEQYLVLRSCVSPRALGRISYLLREGSLGCPRAGSHWKSGQYSYELYGGVYDGQAV